MSLLLIRHGKTQGNLQGRYIGGKTDEPLCPEGVAELTKQKYPPVQRVYTSPMLRCLETAKCLYPQITPVIVPAFRECDFGAFEGKNYAELNGRAVYQAWIDSGGALPFPGGESQAQVRERTARAFQLFLPGIFEENAALIGHGGTLMAIMACYAKPKRDYFFYQPQNGRGFLLEQDGSWRYFPVD